MKRTQFFVALGIASSLAMLSAETRLGNIVVSPYSPGALRPSDQITTTFDYYTEEADGIYVFALPFSGNQGRYSASPGASLRFGSGSGSFWTTQQPTFTGVIDRVLVVAISADQTRTLCKVWVPVEYHIGAAKMVITNISHPSPSALLNGQSAVVSLDYAIDAPGGARVWTVPSNHVAGNQGSGVLTGTGSTTRFFQIDAGINQHVDSFQVLTEEEGTHARLTDYTVPVDLYWSTVGLGNFTSTWVQPEGRVDLGATYHTNDPGVRIVRSPIGFGGSYTTWHTSIPYPVTGTGTDTGIIFNLLPGDLPLETVNYRVLRESDGMVLLDFPTALPEMRHGANDFITGYTLWPGKKARIPNNQVVYATFNYASDDTQPKSIFVRPMTGTVLASGYAAHGSPNYSAMSGSGSGYFYFPSGSHHVTGVRIQIYHSTGISTLIIPVDIDVYEPPAPVLQKYSRAGNDIQLRWASEIYENHRVWRSLSLQSWDPLLDQTNIPTHTDTGGALLGNAFYRIERKSIVEVP